MGDRVRLGTLPVWVAAAVGLLIAARASGALLHPAFLEEEIGGFWAPTFVRTPSELLGLPWNGLLYVLVRAAFEASRLVPVDVAPIVPFTMYATTIALVAGFISSGRLATALPRREVRVCAGLALGLLPFGTGFVYGTMLDVGFWLTIYLATLWLADPPKTKLWQISDVITAAICSLTGSGSLLLAPIYASGLRGPRRAVSWVVIGGALIQLASILGSKRPGLVAEPMALIFGGTERALTSPLGDRLGQIVPTIPILMVIVPAVTLLAVGFAVRSLPMRTSLLLSFVSIAIIVSGLLSLDLHRITSPSSNVRYFLVVAWSLLLVAIAALFSARRSSAVLLAMFVAGLAWSFSVTAVHGPDWACIGGPEACVAGTVVWPHPGTDFRVPIGAWDKDWVYP